MLKIEKDRDLFAGLRKLKLELRKLREELSSEQSFNPQTERNIQSIYRALFHESGTSSRLISRADEIPSKEAHYNRNQNMPVKDLPQSPEMAVEYGWDDSVGVACHQFTSPDRTNKKYVSPDGHSEVIFDHNGSIVTASEDYGTYNFADSRQDPVGHFYQDVLPWLLWGNDETDSTDMHQRLKALVVYGGIEAMLSRGEKDPSSCPDASA